jgi:hypothetical protein
MHTPLRIRVRRDLDAPAIAQIFRQSSPRQEMDKHPASIRVISVIRSRFSCLLYACACQLLILFCQEDGGFKVVELLGVNFCPVDLVPPQWTL